MITVRRLRLATGLVLFSYVTLHLTNLSLGLAGLGVMTEVGKLAGVIWGSLPGTILLYGSLIIHLGLAFQSLYQRRSLRMPPSEALQLILGLSIPPLLAIHIISMRGGAELYGIDSNYRVIQTLFWDGGTLKAFQQVAGLLAAWVHGSLGLYFWLRLKPFFPAWRAPLAALATAVPLTALAGFVASGREVQLRIENDPDWARAALEPLFVASEAERANLVTIEEGFLLAFGAAILLTLFARVLRQLHEARGGRFRLQYSGGKKTVAPVGLSILDVSRANGIAHASVCGGRGRCSTCRVRLEGPPDALDPPGEEEARLLHRIKAPEGVRLACQTRPRGDLTVTLLLPPGVGPRSAARSESFRQGEERVLAVLFADLRGFTSFSEAKLPYDVVFLLNRFAKEMGEAIEEQGGRIDKFMGDGVMALFGLEGGAEEGARQALAAARGMEQRLKHLNESLAAELPQPLRMGIGIHAGPVIVGEIGHGRASSVTAVGDVVNTASRLEAMTKQLEATLLVSESLLALAGEDLSQGAVQEVSLRGREGSLTVRAF